MIGTRLMQTVGRAPALKLSAALVVLSVGIGGAGCAQEATESDFVWAINVAGPAYTSGSGTLFQAEESVAGGVVGQMPLVKGSQDSALYNTYRSGDLTIAQAVANGAYDITFHFAEPADNAPGDRVFDAFAEDERVIDDLDVMLFRDAKIHSALTVTIPGVQVHDGELNLRFDASAGEPVLSALVVRRATARAADWSLVWRDEFDNAGAPDADRWNLEVWPARKVNDEDQAYTARAQNVRVEDGYLLIEALREDYGDARYTSGRVHSRGKGDILYGRVEIRARLPSGKGSWPALWMLPSDPFRYATMCEAGDEWQGSPDCDAWPNSGEIDIMEHVGYQMNHVHGTVHNKAYYWINWEQRKGRVLLDDVARNFHTYVIEWEPEQIRILVGDTLYFVYNNEGDGWESWPFDHAFHLVMNVAVGGYWGRAGGGIDDTIFPQRMLIDYVRVYERAGLDGRK